MFATTAACAAALVACFGVAPAGAGVVNPDISVIGQPFVRWTDAAGDAARKRLVLDPGETELLFDSALNPYARGTVVVAFGEEGAAVEEGYFTLTRGLPAGLALKGGRYRLGFGKLNAQHPHAYPFADRFHVMSAYLPGDESFAETGVQLSEQFAAGATAVTVSLDALQGDVFRIAREPGGAGNDPLVADAEGGDRAAEPRTAVLGRVSAFVPVDDRSGVEFGVSATQGTNNVAAGTTTTLFGADVKAKLWRSANSYLLLQGEYFALNREDAGWDEAAAAYTSATTKPKGFYGYADWAFSPRVNAGVSYERFQDPHDTGVTHAAFGAFAGLALMEETTAFRIGWERFMPGTAGAEPAPDATNTLTLRVVWSMGPHKAHQF
ncbi:MAG: hypothetical protein U0704_16595 [Candidatus Eisenbacteria bacterium]